MKKSYTIMILIVILLFAGFFAFNSCTLEYEQPAQPVSSSPEHVGTIAFSDKAAFLTLTVPVSSDIKTITAVSGYLKYDGVTLGVRGSYDDSNGSIEAVASGMVNDRMIEFAIAGTYNAENGEFSGIISRMIDGGETVTGSFATMVDDSSIGIDLYLGSFGSKDGPSGLGTWNLTVKDGEVLGTFWHGIDNYGGTFKGKCSKDEIIISDIFTLPLLYVVKGKGGGKIKGGKVIEGWYEVKDYLDVTAGGSWTGDHVEIEFDQYRVWVGHCEIYTIEDLKALSAYSCIAGDLLISGLDVKNLEMLERLESIEGDLWIVENEGLKNLEGLDNLTDIRGSIIIDDNEELKDLTGLSGVTSLSGNLIISNNESLKNLDGLNNLVSIGGNLKLSNNESLKEIDGLGGLTFLGGKLIITDNEELKTKTAVKYAIKQLGLDKGSYTIEGNG